MYLAHGGLKISGEFHFNHLQTCKLLISIREKDGLQFPRNRKEVAEILGG